MKESEATKAMTPRPADAWEKRRREDMRIRDRRYGFFRIGEEETKRICTLCNKIIIKSPNTIIVDGDWMHGACFISANRKNNR